MNFNDVPISKVSSDPADTVRVPVPVSVNSPSITVYAVDADGAPVSAAGTATLKATARASVVEETVYTEEGDPVSFDLSVLDNCSFEIEKVSVGSVIVTPSGLSAGQFLKVIVNR
tara:strand:- start:224 stop:568 length:345 start_codon:yes stop_codon:yes gene_type:complete